MRAPRIARVIGLAMAMAAMAAGRAHADPTRADRDEGLRLYEAGRFAEAIPYFDRVLERHHRDIEVRLKRGACYVATNQPAKALADFDWVNRFSAWSAQVFNGGFITNTAASPCRVPTRTTRTASATGASRC